MKFSIRATVFSVLVILFQILFFVLFITLTDYGDFGMPVWITNVTFVLNSSLFPSDGTPITGDVSTLTDVTTVAPASPSAAPLLYDSFKNNENIHNFDKNKLKINNLKVNQNKPQHKYEIKHIRPRFFLPPGSDVPPLSLNATQGPFYCI